MHMRPTEKRWTVQEVLDLPPDGNRYEVVDGELLVTAPPSLTHQHLLLGLARRIADYLDRNPIGAVFIAPVDYFPDENAYVQPDLFVLPGKFEDLPDDWRDIP